MYPYFCFYITVLRNKGDYRTLICTYHSLIGIIIQINGISLDVYLKSKLAFNCLNLTLTDICIFQGHAPKQGWNLSGIQAIDMPLRMRPTESTVAREFYYWVLEVREKITLPYCVIPFNSSHGNQMVGSVMSA